MAILLIDRHRKQPDEIGIVGDKKRLHGSLAASDGAARLLRSD
jgi:hypothetical protein